jgi:transcriptional regulator with XRE-family HTH domain
MEYKKVLNQIEQARIAQRMTKVELCEKSGVAESTYHRLLKTNGSVTLEVFVKLCSALGYYARFEKVDRIDI